MPRCQQHTPGAGGEDQIFQASGPRGSDDPTGVEVLGQLYGGQPDRRAGAEDTTDSPASS